MMSSVWTAICVIVKRDASGISGLGSRKVSRIGVKGVR